MGYTAVGGRHVTRLSADDTLHGYQRTTRYTAFSGRHATRPSADDTLHGYQPTTPYMASISGRHPTRLVSADDTLHG